jgi:hypothetical protein
VREQASETWTVAVAEEEGGRTPAAKEEEDKTKQETREALNARQLNILTQPLYIYLL